MRWAYVTPKNRTMTREEWKWADRALRIACKAAQPEIERACMDMMIYGSAKINIPYQSIIERIKRGR